MEKFEKVTTPVELDFYSIFEKEGVKYIHIFGYSYKSDTYWANMECCWFIEKLADFIKHLKENDQYVDDTYCDVSQYQSDKNDAEMADTINTYFDGKPADYYLPFEEITEETPCGNYVVKS